MHSTGSTFSFSIRIIYYVCPKLGPERASIALNLAPIVPQSTLRLLGYLAVRFQCKAVVYLLIVTVCGIN